MGASHSGSPGGTNLDCSIFQIGQEPDEWQVDDRRHEVARVDGAVKLEGDMWPLQILGEHKKKTLSATQCAAATGSSACFTGDCFRLPGNSLGWEGATSPNQSPSSSSGGSSSSGSPPPNSGQQTASSPWQALEVVLMPGIVPSSAHCRRTATEVELDGGSHDPVVGHIQVTSAKSASSGVNLQLIVDCFSPLLLEIADFLSASPRDYTQLFCLASASIASQVEAHSQPLWETMYRIKWPAFHDYMTFQGVWDWKLIFQNTLIGRVECALEIFDREKKLGFAMAAMAAHVRYDSKKKSFWARYLSATEVPAECIPDTEIHRFRFCPRSSRGKLQPGLVPKTDPHCDGSARCVYPYRVLEGLEGLVVGKAVELQWKMQYGSPFGWWYGHLEALEPSPGASSRALATATITFPHFPTGSPWYRLQVVIGDDKMRVCTFGGYTGGLRPVSDEERSRWMQFFPKELVVF